jgi:hypothetical protein
MYSQQQRLRKFIQVLDIDIRGLFAGIHAGLRVIVGIYFIEQFHESKRNNQSEN